MKDRSKLILRLSFLWAATLLLLGGWWLYLLLGLGKKLEELGPLDSSIPNLANLVKWEGTTFIVLLVLLSTSMLFLYFKDQKKTKSLQDFFASLTHELKTPLASIRLQAEVITELIEKKYQDTSLQNLTERLLEDTSKLETQMDKILQLSRLERGGGMNLTAVELENFLLKMKKAWGRDLPLDLPKNINDLVVHADEFALELIFKNLFENTRNHAGSSQKITLIVDPRKQDVLISYRDGGLFDGDASRLSELFYKHNSSKGSGIGLYLIKKSLKQMNGDLDIETTPELVFHLRLPRYQEVKS